MTDRLHTILRELHDHCARTGCGVFEFYQEIWGVMWYPWFMETVTGEDLKFSFNDITTDDLQALADAGLITITAIPEEDNADKEDRFARTRFRLL